MNLIETQSSSDFKLSPSSFNDESMSNDDFEFAFVVRRDLADSGLDITADEIRQVYPLFGRDIHLPLESLMIEVEREVCTRSGSASSSSSIDDDLEGTQGTSYCAWTPRSVPPSPDRWKKSSSTGSESRRWRIRDLMAGRSHSDGKEKFVFLAPNTEKQQPSFEVVKGKGKPTVQGKEKGKGRKVTEMDMATAHRLYYAKSGGRQRSFLPYKQDLVGFLGLSRSHPF